MRLRSYVILLSTLSVLVVMLALALQMRRVLSDGFRSLMYAQQEHISEILRSSLEAKRSDLADLSHTLRLNNDLASAYVLATESLDRRLIEDRLRGIQREVGLDFIDILSPQGRLVFSNYPGETMERISEEVEPGQEGLRALPLAGRPLLIYFAPLRLYDESVGTLIVGALLDTSAAAKVSPYNEIFFRFLPKHSGALASHGNDAHWRNIRLFTEKEGDLYATIITRGHTSATVSSVVTQRLILIGGVCLGLLLAMFYLMLEFGFVRRFMSIVESIVGYTVGLEAGELKPVQAGKYHIREIQLLANAFAKLSESLRDYEQRVQQKSALTVQAEKERALGELARQVAHDIRSPLAALNSLVYTLTEIPEPDRVLIRSAVNRITDISNTLLDRGQNRRVDKEEAAAQHSLSALLDTIVTEKRQQLRLRRPEIEILSDCSYGLFAQVHAREFQRLISNLVDNAVDALPAGAHSQVRLVLRGGAEHVLVSVQDAGTGIAPELLPRLGERGFTHGKVGGTGLGLYHAKTCAGRWGGQLAIDSTVGIGTSVTLTLPRAAVPDWFVEQLTLAPGSRLLILDDDPTIHHVWRERLAMLKLEERGVKIEHFTQTAPLRAWHQQHGADGPTLYLVDYELVGSGETGIDVIDALGIASQSVLVTSRFEEASVRKACAERALRLLPKALAALVPINYS